MATEHATTSRLLEADLRTTLEILDDLEAVLRRLNGHRLAQSEREELRRAIGPSVSRMREAALLVAANHGIGPKEVA